MKTTLLSRNILKTGSFLFLLICFFSTFGAYAQRSGRDTKMFDDIRSLQAQGNYAEAKRMALSYKSDGKIKDKKLLKELDKLVVECENGEKYMADPVGAKIDNIGSTINSSYPDYAPVISADESTLIFTSRRPGSTGGRKTSDGKYYEDVYVSYNNGGSWSKPENLGSPVNTSTHDACIALSPDGSQLFIYTDANGGDIMVSTLKGKKWTKPENLGSPVNSKSSELSVSISADGRTLYFSSDRDGGFGGMDLYMCTKQGKGWSEPINLGPSINTEYDEDAPFIHPDGRTLYFSSRGHSTMGGYDIFKSTRDGNNWTTPENLGYPINSADDDVYFVLSANNKHGYYASKKSNTLGEKDIYVISMPEPKKVAIAVPKAANTNIRERRPQPIKMVEVTQAANPVTILKGTVTDDETNQPLEADLVLVDNVTGETVSDQKSNSATGKYLVAMPSGKNYGLSANKEGYLFHSENFDIPASMDYQEIVKDIRLKKVKKDVEIVLKNIFFDFDKATLRKESIPELERLKDLLEKNPKLGIEIAGHTDDRGSDTYNQKLSENRAKSVVSWLIQNGISADRLTAMGYGESRPIDTNSTEEGRQNNRRTAFKILKDK